MVTDEEKKERTRQELSQMLKDGFPLSVYNKLVQAGMQSDTIVRLYRENPESLMDEYLTWEGIYGYTGPIMSLARAVVLREIRIKMGIDRKLY